MKKIIFAVDKNSFNNPDHAGVNIKVASQMEQMRQGGNEVELLQYSWVDGELQIKVEPDTDILYFRRIEPSVKLVKTLKKCKKTSPSLKVIMEIPTYPFKGERGRRNFKQFVNNVIGDLLLNTCVDRVAICGADNAIKSFDRIPVLHFSNGVEQNNLPLNIYQGAANEIHMICVSGCMLSHGYDRMIEGLNNYYKSNPERKVFFHIVGTGEYYNQYVELADQYKLSGKYIFFHGRKVGEELDEIYAKCNMAVAHLAAHRIGVNTISSLKSREYAIRGIPFISSTIFDFSCEKTDKYIYYVPANETPIDIYGIVDFFDKVYISNDISPIIRDTFSEMCDWKNTFKPVIEYIHSISE